MHSVLEILSSKSLAFSKQKCFLEEPCSCRKLIAYKRHKHIPTLVALLRPQIQRCETEPLPFPLATPVALWTPPLLLMSGSLFRQVSEAQSFPVSFAVCPLSLLWAPASVAAYGMFALR